MPCKLNRTYSQSHICDHSDKLGRVLVSQHACEKRQKLYKVNVKEYLQGAIWRCQSLRWPDFPCPLELSFGTMLLSSALSQWHILCVDHLLPTAWIICLRCVHFNLQKLSCFLYHRSYTLFQGLQIPPIAFKSCPNLLTHDELDHAAIQLAQAKSRSW